LTAQQQAGGVDGEIIGAVSGALFEPYGIDDPEAFVASLDSRFVTVRVDDEGDKLLVIGTTNDLPRLKSSLAKEIRLDRPGLKPGNWDWEVWKSDDDDLAFGTVDGRFILGDAETVSRCVTTVTKPGVLMPAPAGSVAYTVTHDTDPNASLVSVLGTRSDDKTSLTQVSRVSTAVTTTGIQRTETSYFGLIGSIIERLAKEQ